MMRIMNSVFFPTQRSTCVIKYRINGIQSRMYSKNVDVQRWIKTLDEAQQKRIRFIQNELVLRGMQRARVPNLEQLTKFDYEHILTLSTNQRRKYYRYLHDIHSSISDKIEKSELRHQIEEVRKTIVNENQHIEYSVGKGALIPRLYPRTIAKWKNTRCLWRLTCDVDPKIIFDCSFSREATLRENIEAGKQLIYCFGINRSHRSPFILHYCGINFKSELWKSLERGIPTIRKDPLPLQIHKEDVIDIFPKEKLVFLTPESPNILKEYNPDDHYVINAINQRGIKKPLMLAKAKKYNLRTAHLPLESFRRGGIIKGIPLDQLLRVMLEIKFNRNWNQAFRFIDDKFFNQ